MESRLLWLNLFADLLRFLALSLRSKSSLAAKNLFLRKQLAFGSHNACVASRRWMNKRRAPGSRVDRCVALAAALTTLTVRNSATNVRHPLCCRALRAGYPIGRVPNFAASARLRWRFAQRRQ